jgi:hypothetical protein
LEIGFLEVWQIGQPGAQQAGYMDELLAFKRYIKVASMFSIDNLVRELLEKGQHIGQQSGHQSGLLLNSAEFGLFYIDWLDNQKSGRAG